MLNSNAEIIEYVAKNHDNIIAYLLQYAPYDTLLFWSEKEELRTLQKQKWLPVINRINHETDAAYKYTDKLYAEDIIGKPQNLKKYLEQLAIKKLTVVYICAKELLSVIIGIAFANHLCSVDDALDLAFLEQKFQEEKWGKDELENIKYTAINNRLNTLITLL